MKDGDINQFSERSHLERLERVLYGTSAQCSPQSPILHHQLVMFVGTEAFYMMAEMVDEADFSVFENKTGLAEDMKFLASMPELCDVTFLVGDTREPVCAVKAVLAARSRYKIISPSILILMVLLMNPFFIFLFQSIS